MKTVRSLLIASIIAMGTGFMIAFHAGDATSEDSLLFEGKLPVGYRDWKLVSVAHEEGNLHSFAAMLGNDVAFRAFRDATLPYPDGSIIAALHYGHVASEENNKVFGDPQSFVPGPPTNTQFMIKDSKKYAATGDWGFGHFNKDGSLGTDAQLKTCFPCHAKASRDFVFTRYAP
jgi:hypothetical protein